MGHITKISKRPQCAHNAFYAEKSSPNGYRTVKDCSKPYGLSVNNYVDNITNKFSYKTVYTLVNSMVQNDCFSNRH